MHKNYENKKKIIVYDLDEVLNNLNEYVYNFLKVPSASVFNIKECKEYTEEQKVAILSMYRDPEVFKKLDLVDGGKEILDIESTGKAEVWINSNNLSDEVKQAKIQWLKEKLPEFNMQHVVMQVKAAESKDGHDDAFIIVEDNLLNLRKYSKDTIKILIDKSHNQSEAYNTSDEAEGIIRVKDLKEANSRIKQIVNDLTPDDFK